MVNLDYIYTMKLDKIFSRALIGKFWIGLEFLSASRHRVLKILEKKLKVRMFWLLKRI